MNIRLTEAEKKAAELFRHAEEGSRTAQFRFAESISHTDLPTQLQPVIRTILQKEYENEVTTFEKYTSKETVQTIGEEEAVKVYGWNDDNVADKNHGVTHLPGTLAAVGNRQAYPQIGLQATDKKKIARQFGLALGIDWQAIVNSRGANVNLIRDGVTELARAARRHEDSEPVKNLVTASGFNTAKIGAAGAITGNPAYDDILGIQKAIQHAQSFSIDGSPVHFSSFKMLVAPGAKALVSQALSGRVIKKTKGTGGSTVDTISYDQTIDLGVDLEVIENRWLTTIWSGLGKGFLLIPVGGPRPTITRNYLEGYEKPQLFIKSSNATRFDGGAVPYTDGDFDSDSIAAKVRHVYGSDVLWTEGIAYSTGAGS